MLHSIKSILSLSFVIVGVSLLLVVILGLRQVQLTGRYAEISSLSERSLFAFSTIREQLTESLILGDYGQLKRVIPEIEALNNTVSRLYDNEAVPGPYKLAMAEQIDLTGLVLTLSKMEKEVNAEKSGLELQEQLRRIAERLGRVDRIITGQIRDSVVSFQLSMIGAMGVLLSCGSFILIVLYRKGVKPLLELSRQAEDETIGESGFSCRRGAGSEIIGFVASVNDLLNRRAGQRPGDTAATAGSGDLLSTTVNETANGLNGMINYAQLLLEAEGERPLQDEQRRMLEQIIGTGERIAGRWQKISERFSR